MHFVYEWSGKNPVIGLVAPVSESTWEHLKLLFFPALLWMICGHFLWRIPGRELLAAFTKGICAGMLAIVTLFYTYTGILGFHLLLLDVLTFFLGVLTVFAMVGRMWKRGMENRGNLLLLTDGLILILLALCFGIFTYYVPELGLFTVG